MKTAYPIQWIAGLASIFMPLFTKPDSKKVVLTSFHGDGYRGNTRILFEELCGHKTLSPIWLSRNRKVVRDLKKKFGSNRAELAHSLKGLKALAEASVLMFTHGTSDYPFLRLPRRAIRIQTYHGLPTKRGEYLRPKNSKQPGFLHRMILRYRFQPICFFLSSSTFVTDIFSRRFKLPKHKFIETGYPAYDSLINALREDEFIESIWPDTPVYQSVVLYSPTFRKLSRTKWFPFHDFNPQELAEFLERHKILFLMRPHPNDNLNIDGYQSISNRILNAGQLVVEDVYRILVHTDAIITDYSSIYIEGLLMGIPSVFIPYDLDTYERGLPYSYNQFTPGDKVNSQREFLKALNHALRDPSYYQKERKNVKEHFFATIDGKATERVIRFIESKVL